MATTSGGFDWALIIKPILSFIQGKSYEKSDIIELIQAIAKSDLDFHEHDPKYENFYVSLAALSAHAISSNTSFLGLEHVNITRDTCKILVRHLLLKLSEQIPTTPERSPSPCVSIKQLLVPLACLCGVEDHVFPRSDITVLTMILKDAKIPPNTHIVFESKAGQISTGQSTERRRTEGLTDILTGLLKINSAGPFMTTSLNAAAPATSTTTNTTTSSTVVTPAASTNGAAKTTDGANGETQEQTEPPAEASTQAVLDTKKFVTETCVSYLGPLHGGATLLSLCGALPCLQRYLLRLRQAKEAGTCQYQHHSADATLVGFLVKEVSICQLVMSLPCLEPLTPPRISLLTDIGAAWLLCATTQASVHLKDEDGFEALTAQLVEGALELFNTIGDILKNSTRAGGYVYQNHQMIGTWVLLSGLNQTLSGAQPSTPQPTGKSPARPSRPYNLTRLLQGVQVTWVALGFRCLEGIRTLLADARLEAQANEPLDSETFKISSEQDESVIPASLDALAPHTSTERAARIATCAPLHQLLIFFAVVCFRKATALKRAVVQKQHEQDADHSDSTVYYQDMIMCSEDSETDDEDSEPLLGLWFESTLVAPDGNDASNTAGGNAGVEGGESRPTGQHGVVPDKTEPYSYISLAAEIFLVLNSEIVSISRENSQRLGSTCALPDTQVNLLVALIRDLDRETARTDTGTISPCFGAVLGRLYSEFSSALVRYLHSLTSSVYKMHLSHVLLDPYTSIAPPAGSGSQEQSTLVPIHVGCRIVKAMASLILVKKICDREACILSVWSKTVSTLTECALQPQPSADHEFEDMNVEFAQLLVYLFHSLNLMQKKSVLITTANAIIKVSEGLKMSDRQSASQVASHQLMIVTRLLLLLEYIMKHLYDAPPCLLQQIEWNLVIAPGLSSQESASSPATGNAEMSTRMFCTVPHVEQAYRKKISQDADVSMRPKFYALTNTEINNQETPKLDGLACNFVLGTPDKLKYPQLLSALLSLLNCSSLCDHHPPLTVQALCAAHYCFQTAWRLVITMPPSTPHMEKITGVTDVPLHSLIWGPRASHQKTFSPWLKDALVKQGMYTQYAENLLGTVTTICDNTPHAVWMATNAFKHLQDNILSDTDLPPLIDVMTANCTLLRVRFLLEEEAAKVQQQQVKETPKTSSTTSSTTTTTSITTTTTPISNTTSSSSSSPSPPPTTGKCLSLAGKQFNRDFCAQLLDILETVLRCCRICVARDFIPTGEDGVTFAASVGGPGMLEVVLRCCGSRAAPWLRGYLPPPTKASLDKAASGPPLTKPISTFTNDAIPSESGIMHVVSKYCQLMSSGTSSAPLLMLAMEIIDTLSFYVQTLESTSLKERAISLLLPACVDGRLEYLQDHASGLLNQIISNAQKVEQAMHKEVLSNMYLSMVGDLSSCNDKILKGMVKYWEKVLERPAGRQALEELFGEGKLCLGEVLISAPSARQPYISRVVRFLNNIFQWCSSSSPVMVCIRVVSKMGSACSTPSPSSAQPRGSPSPWLAGACLTSPPAQKEQESSPSTKNGQDNQQSESCSWSGGASDSKESVALALFSETSNTNDNALLLENLTRHMIQHCDESSSTSLLEALISLAPEALRAEHAGLPLPRLLREAARLADAHSGSGHRELLPAALKWLNTCVESLQDAAALDSIEQGVGDGQQKAHLEAACHLLAYVSDCLHACFGPPNATGVTETVGEPPGQLPSWDAPLDVTPEADWADDPQDEDDTSADDSDEDSMLHLKLCTFTTTAREYMNQHWYHCHTCKMVDSVGVCTVCALVCHRNHDVTYAKYGNFFCDCGAKEDSSCQALVKRSSSHSTSLSRRSGEVQETQPPPSLLRRRPSSPPNRDQAPPHHRRPAYASNITGIDPWIWDSPEWQSCISGLQKLLVHLGGPVARSCERHSPVGRHARARQGLAQLHSGDVKFQITDQLMVPTLGSQEGAFENVRMSYTGEQGQAIRHLIVAHVVRRVAMCCMALPNGKRQHLAVSHEKGKITILQLSQLLKQADSSKRKLTLTRLTSASIPFPVLSLSASPYNEDVLAVTGYKDCHVLTFTGGPVYQRLVMQPGLDPGNFIIKSIWLPGNQTQLALVTADFVKIYDLSKDASVPEYHFLVPSGKVRDVTFVSLENDTFMLCMASAGHIYWQAMNEVSHATNGPFYITNTVDVVHNDIKDVNGQVGGGGVSLYYSHTLKMLFFSYAQGKSFMAPLTSVDDTLDGVTLIQVNQSGSGSSTTTNNSGSGKGSNKGAQALCQWQEVPGHPGLVTAVLQASNNPIVMMLTPDSLMLQEIKVVPAKAKITDMVAVRHSAAGDSKTTLILLCEDGSLRIYAANPEMTGYWLSPSVSPTPSANAVTTAPSSTALPAKPGTAIGGIVSKRFRNSSLSKAKNSQGTGKSGGSPSFPVDFFEHCVALNDVEFGGNDLLQVYNTSQIKHRLATNGLYVVSTKLSGFNMEITNTDSNTVITGIRVLLGNQDVSRTPTYIEVCGRTIPTVVNRNRWFDIPLTREESLSADRKLVVTFGPSQDADGVCMVDSVKVYGRNKEAFGWPEDNEEGICAAGSKLPQESGSQTSSWTPPGVERLACGLLEALELSLGAPSGQRWWTQGPKETATNLLCSPCPVPLQARCKALLHALLGQSYHQHKDEAILSHVMEQLREMYMMEDARNADPENFFRLLLLARAVAAVRPQNLVKYAGTFPNSPSTPSEWNKTWTSTSPPLHLAPLLVGVLSKLSSVAITPCPPCLAPVDRSGLRHHDHALHALADIIHTLMVHTPDQTMIDLGNRIYLSLLLCEDQLISFGAKSAIVRVLRPRVKRRRVYIPSPPATPGDLSNNRAGRSESPQGAAAGTAQSSNAGAAAIGGDQNHNQARQFMYVDQVFDLSRLLGTDPEGLETLLDPPDADDEAMVEYAIVLSLQEGRGGAQNAAAALPRGGSGAPSDATASATGSDDEEGDGEVEGEGEGAAGSGGAEVSPVGRSSESGSATSGRSSAYGETTARTAIEGGEASQWSVDIIGGADTAAKVRSLRLALLDLMVEELPNLRGLPGLRTIPFMQVLLMLSSSMECGVESEQVALERCLCFLVSELSGNGNNSAIASPESPPATAADSQTPVQNRTPRRELQLLIMRLLSVLMARWKPTSSSTPGPSTSTSTSRLPSEWYTARTTASWLRSAGVINRCEEILRELLPYWKEIQSNPLPTTSSTTSAVAVSRNTGSSGTGTSATNDSAQNDALAGNMAQLQLLKPQPPHPMPDMQPFFLRQYVKSHAWDVLENYPNLLTEMSLRLPYQVQQHCEPPAPPFSTTWHSLLCQYMMNQQTPFLRKQVRKLLLMMCGTKEKYRQLRDVHALNVHLEGVHKIVEELDFSYDRMVALMDHLKACVEIVTARTGNWQHMCWVHSPNTLSYLMGAACLLGRSEGEAVTPTILQLLQGALCNNTVSTTTGTAAPLTTTTNNDRTERGRSAESDASITASSKFQESLVPQLVQQILSQVKIDQLRHFVKVFLLETNSTSVRWQAHALLLAIYENCSLKDGKEDLVRMMWELWPALAQYGRKTAQFVDLLGYFSLKTPQIPMEDCLKSAVNLLKAQNQVLTQHGNAPIYSALSNYVELEGYYLESEPCLVCNNPETPMSTIKLSTVRIDSKFTTQTQIVKLAGSHTISRIGLRIGDLKRTKMVRKINVFYNNRTVQAVQELKNKPGMWHKAKTVVLLSGQTDVRIDFPLPIVACNLMMEYADFYENTQASGESLQCPRCSAAVPANPGVCANCGENVFQCHKCRAINYDEKDPFLCHACGFCKYAKFDYTLTARSCCAVERIENDEDRKRMVVSIGLLLDKADRVYRQLVANKPLIENLLHKISEHRVDVGRTPGEDGTTIGSGTGVVANTGSGGNSTSSGAQVNRVIQYVAHKYCVDSKNHFDDLSKIIQRVLTCRRELVAYDKLQSDQLKSEAKPPYTTLLQQETLKTLEPAESGHCYGCALAAASHCLTLLRALASSPENRQRLCQLGLVTELVHHNLRRGTPQSQEEVRQLICVVTRDNLPATKELCNLLSQRITLGLLGHAAAQDHTNAVRPLVLLLGGLVKIQDSSDCWEVRLRCVIRLWVWCCPYLSSSLGISADDIGALTPLSPSPGHSPQDAHALQQVALPCLQYLHHIMQPPTNKDGTKECLEQQPEAPPLDLGAWLAGRVSYADWKRRRATPAPTRDIEPDALTARDEKLALKYTNRWKAKAFRTGGPLVLFLGDGGWLKPVMFNPSSKMARDVACQMIKSLCTSYERTNVVLLLLTHFLPGICTAGEASEQFLQLYQSLASEAPWKQFLALHGVLSMLADLLTKEIDHLHILEETTLTSDLAQGYALKRLTELMAMFLEEPGVRRAYKGRLMGAVLGGYLSLRRLVVQRTRLIDDTQEKLLELLEEMTTGTEAETAEFMAVCIETVKKYPLHDFRTPVFIFERLCSIIYPEENDVGEFFLSLEKDPQQEDFLQGRMLGNPYSSLEAGLGPLMRDVKNKICTDCELVALLEDDNGMELLVNNKIMSLDLPVKEVYKKVWCTSGEVDAMRVVYRMRGLLGDATEEFVETLSSSTNETVDDEQVYRMANVLAYCGGMEVMLERLAVAGGGGGAARPLARTLLRLLSLCVRAKSCVRVLTQHTTQALPALLQALNMTLNDERNLPRPELTCNLLEIMDRILSVAAGESMESFLQFSLTFGGPEYVQTLLNCTQCPGIRSNQEALQHLTRVLAALVYGNELKMAHLCQHFKQVLDFNKFDAEHRAEDEFRLELFCVLCSGIERNAIGGTLKDYLISLGIVKDALDYITMHAPCVKPTLLRTDSDELKEFISKPALKYILRFLTGLATDHEPTQMAVCEKVIPIVHRLEQVSSDEHVGSLAENLLEALMTEPLAAKRVRDARDYTRQEKKRLAMAMREKQLGALGMRTNDKGQVTAQCSLTHQVQELGEETGAICCICREGYKYQPTKVLGIYTFTKRCPVEEFEVKARKTLGYTTVTHFNVVHVECHMAAVRLARSRDEWESAALQNASTKCNGLLPLWGPHVPESAFASCLARHNTYLQECTGHHDIGYQCTVHDLKLLLLRFAREKPFHEDTGGGGPLSNMQLVPSLIHMALYVINTTRIGPRLIASLQAYLEWGWERQLESSHEAEGPLYYLLISLLMQPPNKWRECRLEHLRRILILAQARSVSPSVQINSLSGEQLEPRSYEEYKPYLVYFSLVQLLYDEMFKQVPTTPADQWSVKLAEAIRHGDEGVLRCSERILSTLSEQMLPCQSIEEWLDVAGLLGDVPNPGSLLRDTLQRTT